MAKIHALAPKEFMAHREILEHPDDSAVFDAFARLPKRGCIEVRCGWEHRLERQRTLAEAGAFAIYLEPLMGFQEVLIIGFKGKVGACFETGRSATYTGAALAVMDDDHHLIVGTIRVCEKTGGLYTLPPYEGLLTVTEGDSDLLDRLEIDPTPFDCNTFEPDAERLAAKAFAPFLSGEPSTSVFYPGPFSLLVLRDGSMLRRGHGTRIAMQLVKDLQDRDGLLLIPPHRAAEADRPIHYPTAYRSVGARCLMGAAVTTAACSVAVSDEAGEVPLSEQALDALARSSDHLRRRLHRLIAGEEPYFILTGSDPKDYQGCCPSTLVGEANRLVDMGLLSCYRGNAAADNCTTTIYALAGEIKVRDSQPEFTINVVNRLAVAAALNPTGARSVPDGQH
jgi:hypothetical protein